MLWHFNDSKGTYWWKAQNVLIILFLFLPINWTSKTLFKPVCRLMHILIYKWLLYSNRKAPERSHWQHLLEVWLYLQFLVCGGPTSSLNKAYRAALRDSPLIPSPHSFSALWCDRKRKDKILFIKKIIHFFLFHFFAKTCWAFEKLVVQLSTSSPV